MLRFTLPQALFVPVDDIPIDVHFRPAILQDCRPLHTACYPEKPFFQFRSQFQQLLDWQEDGRCCWCIALDPTSKIIASGQLVIYPHGAELANLSVIPDAQNKGIGTALIHVLTAVARHWQLSSLEISVSVNNDRASSLYKRLGFKEDRRINTGKDGPIIILHKAL